MKISLRETKSCLHRIIIHATVAWRGRDQDMQAYLCTTHLKGTVHVHVRQARWHASVWTKLCLTCMPHALCLNQEDLQLRGDTRWQGQHNPVSWKHLVVVPKYFIHEHTCLYTCTFEAVHGQGSNLWSHLWSQLCAGRPGMPDDNLSTETSAEWSHLHTLQRRWLPFHPLLHSQSTTWWPLHLACGPPTRLSSHPKLPLSAEQQRCYLLHENRMNVCLMAIHRTWHYVYVWYVQHLTPLVLCEPDRQKRLLNILFIN